MYKRKSSDKQIDELVYKAEHDGFGINEEELDEYMAQYPFGSGSNPIGTIIAFMGNTPPEGYLACDGSEYDIVDYPKLAKFFKDQFGSTQYFGGTGDKFKVPDLRGEFLRGTGTNSHSMGGVGESVGVHQAPTKHKRMCLGGTASNALIVYSDASDNANSWLNNSVNEDDYSTSVRSKDVGVSNWISNTSNTGMFTSRPTNTSVLYCIKADTVTTDELDETYLLGYDLYSNDEIVIGCWTNGKPIYQRTISSTYSPSNSADDVVYTITDFSLLINIFGVFGPTTYGNLIFNTPRRVSAVSNTVTLSIGVKDNGDVVISNGATQDYMTAPINIHFTVQYTKSTDPENSFDFTQLSDIEKININNVPSGNSGDTYYNYIGYDDYSTNEKIIGKWTNGKPLYQRAFTNVNPKSNTVLLSGVENIADWTFLRHYASNNTNSVIAHEGVINENWVYVKLTNGNVVLSSVASAYSAGNGTFVIKYTKTADVINSFNITQLSNFTKVTDDSNNYSTDEKVIGTWIDGKPLYQKTITGYSIPSGITDGTNKAVTIEPNISNLSRITSIDGFIASDTSTSMLPLNGILGASNSSSVFNVGAYVTTANKVTVTCNKASLSEFSIFLTIKYTKTTD